MTFSIEVSFVAKNHFFFTLQWKIVTNPSIWNSDRPKFDSVRFRPKLQPKYWFRFRPVFGSGFGSKFRDLVSVRFRFRLIIRFRLITYLKHRQILTYFQHSADAAIIWTVLAEDDFPILEIGDVGRNSEIEKSKDVDSGWNLFEDERVEAGVCHDGPVVEDDHALGRIKISAFFDRISGRPVGGKPGSPPVVNFTKILWAAFAPIFFRQQDKKAKLWVEKSNAKHFCKKNLLIKS